MRGEVILGEECLGDVVPEMHGVGSFINVFVDVL